MDDRNLLMIDMIDYSDTTKKSSNHDYSGAVEVSQTGAHMSKLGGIR